MAVQGDSLAGFRRIILADGVMFVPPEGHAGGVIQIRPNRPLMRLSELLALFKTQIPAGFKDVTLDVKRSASMEGAYIALVRMKAVGPGGEDLRRTIALIFAEEGFASIDGATTLPDRHHQIDAAVEKLAQRYWLGLGEKRRRRYFYRPPAGWQGMPRTGAAAWIPPDYPKNRAMITIFDAHPAELTPPLVQDRSFYQDLPADFRQETIHPPLDLKGRGLTGRVIVIAGSYPGLGRVHNHDAAITDERWVYFVRLESDERMLQQNRGIFLALLDTIEPLPQNKSSPGALIQWAD